MSRDLLKAATSNDINKLKLLLANGALIDYTNTNGQSALTKASGKGHYDIVDFLLSKGALNDGAHIALNSACKGGHTEVAKLLIDTGISVNFKGLSIKGKSLSYATPLISACDSKNISTVEMLLDKGADVNLHGLGSSLTPLMHVCIDGNEAIYTLLIEKEANIDAQDEFGRTALMLLCSYEFKYGTKDKNKDNMAKNIIEIGADIDIKNNDGKTALDVSAGEINSLLQKIILDRGVDEQNDCHMGL